MAGVPEPATGDTFDPVAALSQLVAIRSVSDGKNEAAVTAMRQQVVQLFRAAGVEAAELPIGDGTSPIVYAATPTRPELKTVLLYAHYDVVPADGPWTVDGTTMDPFTPTMIDGRLYGRGAADDKSGIVLHLGTVCEFAGRLPVNLILLVEGAEEIGGGTLDEYVRNNPDRFRADVVVVADTGNLAVDEPAITTTLRGMVIVDVQVSTLAEQCHSGMYGGAAPDPFLALVKLLGSIVDDAGDVTVPGLTAYRGGWQEPDEARFRADAKVLDGVRLTGTGALADRLFGRPSVTVTGLTGLPPAEQGVNQLQPSVTARLSVRIAPDQSPADAVAALRAHLDRARPWGAHVTVTEHTVGPGFAAHPETPEFQAAEQALAGAYGRTTARTGQGGSIPLVATLQQINKGATVILWGCEEPVCRIHGEGESVAVSEVTRMTRAQTQLLRALAGA
ncbi:MULTISPECIES: M20/M25/M40 family metallo-hydrolase [unclassified Micromonospora]|uniref:M20/M25/M40 family metallo-hydrolase n=1 Tax=unclassified Micromonospora TaxID=2617518 RepID=UPI00098D477C|nr:MULTISPECIES: M20/M25/M40 family metallo-hydrolase [unclassified Micromonospora]MDI5936786.1 M20/M25/M40 family metallo-hydrolase [Micromonospora sp. DH15]OON30684.1 hypothetical protein BSA16_14955 [Micromonospora sp. Rc5]